MRGLVTSFLTTVVVVSCVGAGPQPARAPVPPPLPVMVSDTDTMGRVFTDPHGRTLYHNDVERNGTFICVGLCTDTRKPLLHEPGAELRLPPGIAGTLGTVRRPDGGDQVTYNGSPLYWFTGDQQPADTRGVTLLWHVINPQNVPVS
ncbi:hypothetical protein OG936_05690 [Streptomyces sp. NBC_00846]|uniref:COG4315 family predicted lipoprotein n=1 Tax=Streptomyces sp. NBC_00846 TaxID=2975849 RepID=UPI00386AA906|nr:hypothetical protein OG936_05690 [Streptomyces sp. NBC_00846]